MAAAERQAADLDNKKHLKKIFRLLNHHVQTSCKFHNNMQQWFHL